MARIDDLIQQITDEELRNRIQNEAKKLSKQKTFGLVFEEHLPECSPLYDIPVSRGKKVTQKTVKEIKEVYTVIDIQGEKAICLKNEDEEPLELNIDDLVVIAKFGEPIYPYLKPIDSVCNAPDSALWHTLIEADNYHALQLLEYLYAGKVDCIYIDPPYNTGAKDWKYNNNYVDDNDSYRHSKWLSFMKKRLELAKRLLSKDGVLICAIDENESATLRLLVDDIFKNDYEYDCIAIIHNPRGIQGNNFSYTNEFAQFIIPKKGKVLNDRKLLDDEIDWSPLRNWGSESLRTDAKNCFYPIIVKDFEILEFGDVCDDNYHPQKNEILEDGKIAIYPIDSNGIERKWRYARQSVEDIAKYLEVVVSEGKYDIKLGKDYGTYKTVWTDKRYDSNTYGKKLINSIIPDSPFDFPKSLWNVYECLHSVVSKKPNAIVLDFFAGSGTTLHAINLLNYEDGGNRRCIMVTNNEVSAAESAELVKQGYQPGDEEWERLGIARHVTWSRTVCSINGHDINGKPLTGYYGVKIDSYEKAPDKGKGLYRKKKKQIYPQFSKLKMSDGFKANAAFFKLGFLDKDAVARREQLKELMSVLWMKAGCYGTCPILEDNLDMIILPENRLALLNKESSFIEFEEKLQEHPEIETVFFVTDSENAYRRMIAGLSGKKTYQLYRDYLDNFRINTAR